MFDFRNTNEVNNVNIITYETGTLSQKKSREFNDSFKGYSEALKFEINKIEEKTEKEDYLDYLFFINSKAHNKGIKGDNYNYLINNIVKNKLIEEFKSDEINKLFNIFIKKMNREQNSIFKRNISKSLDIVNEVHSDIISSLKKIESSINKIEYITIKLDSEVLYVGKSDYKLISKGNKDDNENHFY